MKRDLDSLDNCELIDRSPSLPWVVYRLGRINFQSQRLRIRQAAFTSYVHAQIFVRAWVAINPEMASCLRVENTQGRLPDDPIAGRA